MREVHARETRVINLELDDARSFIEKNHKIGWAKPGKMQRSYGLVKDDEVLCVIYLCNPRTKGKQKLYTTEIFRFSFQKDVRIVGGGGKLIQWVMKNTKLWDLFIYQDSEGENTSMYEHAGLILAEKAKKKEVLVRDGLTYKTAENNMSDWLSLEQATTRCPSKLLEIAAPINCKGKSNIDLLIENYGYHIEEISGDSIYEWRNPELNFYIYKISSLVDENYYIGRRAIWNQNPTIEDCLKDPYMGSGGQKFQNWIENVGSENLLKEVLEIVDAWSLAIKSEKRFIGDFWQNDKNCMNSKAGGVNGVFPVYTVKECSDHGETTFNGSSCMKCVVQKQFTKNICEIHGETSFKNGKCHNCSILKSMSTKICPVHGSSTFKSSSCLSCVVENTINLQYCEDHGMVLHYGLTCSTCTSQKSISTKLCPIHGKVKHQGEVCSTCNAKSAINLRKCPAHGESTHQGHACMKCNATNQLSKKSVQLMG